MVIAAWGASGGLMGRDKVVTSLLEEIHCLGLTTDGRPRHPLYLRSDTKPVKLQV